VCQCSGRAAVMQNLKTHQGSHPKAIHPPRTTKSHPLHTGLGAIGQAQKVIGQAQNHLWWPPGRWAAALCSTHGTDGAARP
jgi:hypothetical protein